MTYELEPVLSDIHQYAKYEHGDQWAVEYGVYLADRLHRKFNFARLMHEPDRIGYEFFLLVRSVDYNTVNEDIDEQQIERALVLEENDPERVREYLEYRINKIGRVTWDEFEIRLGEFLDISDIDDDDQPGTKGA